MTNLQKEFEKSGYTSWVNTDELPPNERIYTPEYTKWLEEKVEELKKEALTTQWNRVEDRPLIISNNGRWTVTEDGENDFIAAVKTNKKWWIRHCVIDYSGLCVVCDHDYEPSGWEIEDVILWKPMPSPPV